MAIARRLDELTVTDAARFGGKAVQCGVLIQAGFPVPEGIAIAFDDDATLPREVREWLDARPAMRFAVRSSATDEDSAGSSFAGIHESVLDVDAGGVESAVAECLASMCSDRARAYRVARGLPERGGAAVLIQRMIEPVRAGVAFTADPVSGDRGVIVINSALGRGDAVVGGTIQPDETRARKGEARDALADLMLRIERHYGTPQDVEWCDDGSTIWIVQARPITSLPEPLHGIEWTRANAREVLPDLPSPSFVETFLPVLEKAYERFFGSMMDPAAGPFVRSINGRVYFNLTQMRRMARLSGESEATALRSLGHADNITSEDEKRSRPRIRDLMRMLPVIGRMLAGQLMLKRNAPRWMKSTRRYHDEIRAIDAATASDRELIQRMVDWFAAAPERMFFPVIQFTAVMPLENAVRRLCAKRGVDGDALLLTYLGAGERSVTSQQAVDLVALARVKRDDPQSFDAALQRFLDEYGHRGIFETDWSLPRLAEDPTPVHDAIRAHLAAGEIPHPDVIAAQRQRAWDEVWSAAKPRLRWHEQKLLLALLRRIKWMYLGREQWRSAGVRVMFVQRLWHLELAKRFAARGWIDNAEDYFLLSLDEVAGDPSRLRAIVAEKSKLRDQWKKLEMPLLLRDRGAAGSQPVGDMRGLCISPGIVEAPVAILTHPSQIDRFPRGAILVTVATDPSWTPVFTLASGVIVEIGGTLSHAATVARELGLPALANVRDATKLLRDGMRVRLDATGGVVLECGGKAAAF